MIARQPQLGASGGPERTALSADERDSVTHVPTLLAAPWDRYVPAPDLGALTCGSR